MTRGGMVAALALALAGCGPAELCSPTGELGSCCTGNAECNSGLCVQTLPNGYCSAACDNRTPCPVGGACVDILYSGGSYFTTGKYCLKLCDKHTDCRTEHGCEAINDSDQNVCFFWGT